MKKVVVVFMALIAAIAAGQNDLNDLFEGSDLLKQLKDSGVIDQFEEELKQMLKEEGNKKADQKVKFEWKFAVLAWNLIGICLKIDGFSCKFDGSCLKIW